MRKVETLASGRYKVRFRLGTSPRTGKPLQGSETFDLKREATEFAKWVEVFGAAKAVEMLADSEADRAVPNLDQLAAEHIGLRPNTTDGTRLNYERLWARTWGPQIGHMPANRLTEDDLARAVMLLGRTYSRKSLENQRGLLSGVVGRAARKGYLPENIARGMALPAGTHGDHAEMRIISPEEFEGVCELVPDHYLTFVRFLYATGLRWGEAVALEVRDVALPNIHVRRALKWSPDNNRVVGPPKTQKGKRTLEVTSELHDELHDLIADRAGTDLVFTAKRGGPILHRTFWGRVWLPAVSHLKPRPRIHDLRHSHASILLARGIPIHIVQRRLGHNSIQVTVDKYGHLLPDAQALAAEASSFALTARRPLALE